MAVGSGAVAVGVGVGVVAAVGVLVGIAVLVAVAVAGSRTSGVTVADGCSPSAIGLFIAGDGRAGGVAVHVGHGVAVGHGVQVADGWLVALTTNARAVGVLLRLGCDAAR